MGGYSSGRYRTRNRGTVEETVRLDMPTLRRKRFLQPGRSVTGPIYWTRGGERSGAITLTVNLTNLDDAHARLAYTSNGEPIVQVVQLVADPCRFGGHRFLWLCPVTWRRCAMIACAGGRFASRQAQRLTYATQSADTLDRLKRASVKAEARALGRGGHARPRGANRERLIERWIEVDRAWEDMFAAVALRRFGRLF